MKKKKRKYLTCRNCKEEWNVSINNIATNENYICPDCRDKINRKREQVFSKTLIKNKQKFGE